MSELIREQDALHLSSILYIHLSSILYIHILRI